MENKQTVLVCPLNWGLGHATRCVPIIRRLMDDGHRVIIGACQGPLSFLRQEFPDLEFVPFPGFRMRYFRKPFLFAGLILQAPVFYFSFWWEQLKLRQIVTQYGITWVISDNRYGVHHAVYSVLLTHQLFIQLPKSIKWLEKPLYRITRQLVNRFNECWVPDYEEDEISLSGKLSHGHPLPQNVRYIGPLSRFSTNHQSPDKDGTCPDVLVLISGPEPQRTMFEQEMEQRFDGSNQMVLIICGKPEINHEPVDLPLSWNGVVKVNHLNTELLQTYLANSRHIIARSGYSTIMDLHVLGRTAEWIPTPGQTEQEYLAEWINTSTYEKEKV